jgi:hypothetical protein
VQQSLIAIKTHWFPWKSVPVMNFNGRFIRCYGKLMFAFIEVTGCYGNLLFAMESQWLLLSHGLLWKSIFDIESICLLW